MRSGRLRFVAAMTRTLTVVTRLSEPTAWISPFSRKRRSGLHPQAHFAGFVQKMVPPCAVCSLPSVSIGTSEAALHVSEELRLEQRLSQPAQLTGTGCDDRRDSVNASGDESLPTPLSPVMRTLPSDTAALSAASKGRTLPRSTR